ncbi:hypothetical protein AURANDRAFT_62418 [Aureococcus anophagefferens]|uniref:Uncharacterized protein n=1 Tax=Aureococcus anophagefferens TaxID=44056 RepID=F0Y1T3_AURAN|nr:hypothetical protein AURANDRAFT_62418 [Aureococcus anophagefferens]EGB10875.1 hypothetical protein AURANDRAFT_62418 [Aureococcus anophagefferens]|eukprot:XP_009034452.1 hypothetical protein AURANDRAFT_62418 [Aureococcus anophagefferens]
MPPPRATRRGEQNDPRQLARLNALAYGQDDEASDDDDRRLPASPFHAAGARPLEAGAHRLVVSRRGEELAAAAFDVPPPPPRPLPWARLPAPRRAALLGWLDGCGATCVVDRSCKVELPLPRAAPAPPATAPALGELAAAVDAARGAVLVLPGFVDAAEAARIVAAAHDMNLDMKAAIATSSAEPPVAEVMQRLLDKYARMRGRAASPLPFNRVGVQSVIPISYLFVVYLFMAEQPILFISGCAYWQDTGGRYLLALFGEYACSWLFCAVRPT